MFCRKEPPQMLLLILLLIGLVTLVFGLTAHNLPAAANMSTNDHFLGMLSGAGCGLMGVAIFFGIRKKILSPEKRQQEKIEKNDERNITIQRAALSICALSAIFLLAFFAFLFNAMGYLTPSYLCIGGMYALLIIYLLSLKIFQKKM